MNTNNKLVTIVAILWVAAVGAITVAFVANRPERFVRYGTYRPDGTYTGAVTEREFSWGGWLAWAGTVTLVALAAMAIVLVVFRKTKRLDA